MTWHPNVGWQNQVSAALVGLLAFASTAVAQAWLPDKGTGSISFVTQSSTVVDHYFGSTRVDAGRIISHDFIIDASYGVTRRFAIRFGVPFVMAKYNGSKPHDGEPGYANYDTGQYHGTWQDLTFDARYALTPDRDVAVTPFVSLGVPSHDYYFYAHSAPGQDVRVLQVGTYVARRLDRISTRLFLQARVAFGFVEPVLSISHDRIYLDVEATYFFSEKFRMFFTGGGFATHGGIDFPVVMPRPALVALGESMGIGDAIWINHDRIGAEDTVNIGLGGSIAVSQAFDLFGSAGTNVLERNGHSIQRILAFGLTWHFARTGSMGALRDGPKLMIARCVCKQPG